MYLEYILVHCLLSNLHYTHNRTICRRSFKKLGHALKTKIDFNRVMTSQVDFVIKLKCVEVWPPFVLYVLIHVCMLIYNK